MELIDDEGNLFGAINVIDALAILLVLAVGAAGIAVVAAPSTDDTGSDNSELDTRYATINLGNHPDYVADRITAGDTMERDDHNLTVTDVYSTPVDATTEAVTIRAQLDGEIAEATPNTPRFEFAGTRFRVGDTLTIETDEYAAEGSIQRLDEDGSDLNTEYITTEVKLENIDRDVAAGISEGLTQTSHGEPLVTVQSVTTQPAEVVLQSEDGNIYLREHPTNKDVRLTVELRTIETESGNRFHNSPLRIGQQLRLDLGTTTVTGTVSELSQ